MRTKYSIAISGSHGKTTTTSLISHILMVAQIDPTVIIGGNLINLSTNARIGNGDFVVVEADESDRSFLHLDATIAVVTNIDLEHLETYNDINDIKQTFLQFLENIPFYGKAIVCNDNEHVRSIIPITHVKTITYGITYPSDFYATDILLHKDHTICTVWYHTTKLGTLHIAMPGTHNVLNALAAIAVAHDLEIPFDVISHALASFKGIERRFSLCGIYKGAEIFDDYGHHPQEILQTLNVAYNRTKGKIVVVFQPHRYSRTYKLWDQFVDVFSNAFIDHLIITDIYAASELAIEHVHSRQLVADIKAKNPAMSTQYIPYSDSLMELKEVVDDLITPDTLVLLQGAGKINRLAKSLL
jgi:UDP-N-acetylmuramate--alanine ligase